MTKHIVAKTWNLPAVSGRRYSDPSRAVLAGAAIGKASAAAALSVVGSGSSYSTNFDATENPISESGAWVQGGLSTGLDWNNARSSGGLAYASAVNANFYDDSISLLSGFTANHRVSAVIRFTNNRSSATNSHEVELILRGSYTAHVQHLYECNIGYSGASGWYMQIMRMDGGIGEFTEITQIVNTIPDIQNGDDFAFTSFTAVDI